MTPITKSYLEYLNSEISRLQLILKKSPKGKLICTRNGKFVKWYIRDGNEFHYLPKRQCDLARSLARKRIAEQKLSDLIRERSAVSLYLRHHVDLAESDIQFYKENAALIKLASTPDLCRSYDMELWQNEPYIMSTEYPENKTLPAKSGNMVRSKSEYIIDSCLLDAGIPFRYECRLMIGNVAIYPDFTTINPITGEKKYLEHLGMLDNQKYVHTFNEKLSLYTSAGIILGQNLFITCESGSKHIDVTDVMHVIDKLRS